MQKECVICGDTFEAKRESRQYCDKCQKNTSKARKMMSKAIVQNKLNAGDYDRVKNKVCSYCGKEFKTIYGSRSFCSKHCELRYKIENNMCQYCGKPLYPEIETTAGTVHAACKEPAYRAWAIRNGRVRNCEECGKEYYAKTEQQRFCCRECSKIYQKKHREEYVRKRIEPEKQYRCAVCKKIFVAKVNYLFENNPSRTTCSERCREICEKAHQKRLEQRRLEEEKQAAAKRQAEIEHNGLCSLCRTNNADCDWIRSKFRIKPKGAKYKNSKIVECPQFTE